MSLSPNDKGTKLPELPHSAYFPAIATPMLPKECLRDKVALVTGGGTGIGLSIAHRLSSLGATVVIASRKIDVLQTAAAEVTKETGNRVIPLVLNLREPADISRFLDECEVKVGLPNVIVSNAAANFISPTERLSANAWKAIVDTVFFGATMLVTEIGKRLIAAKKPGTFLAISATYARDSGSAFMVPSASSKAALEIMHKSLAVEWAKYGLRFNVIEPGPFYTKGAFDRLDPTGEWLSSMPKTIPVGRLGNLGELSNLASYMVSDYSSFLNGAVICLDGGGQHAQAGRFGSLHTLSPKQWDMMEKIIRGSSSGSKL